MPAGQAVFLRGRKGKPRSCLLNPGAPRSPHSALEFHLFPALSPHHVSGRAYAFLEIGFCRCGPGISNPRKQSEEREPRAEVLVATRLLAGASSYLATAGGARRLRPWAPRPRWAPPPRARAPHPTWCLRSASHPSGSAANLPGAMRSELVFGFRSSHSGRKARRGRKAGARCDYTNLGLPRQEAF